jgi:hypothetical protein
MKPDDPLLSNFLDGELTPEERRTFEASMATDPSIGEILQDLTRVRDAVASLPRPGLPISVDLASAVLSDLRASRQRRTWSPLRVPLMASALAAAAAIWLAIANPLHVPPQRRPTATVRTRTDLVSRVPETPRQTSATPISSISPTVGNNPLAGRVVDELDRETERVQLRQWLDGQDVRQIVVKAGPALRPSDRLAGLLRTTARQDPNFAHLGAIRLPGSGVDVDSFAVVLRPCELEHLVGLIGKEFPEGGVGKVESIAGGPNLYPLGDSSGLRIVAGTPINRLKHPRGADRRILARADEPLILDELAPAKTPDRDEAEPIPPAVPPTLARPEPLTLLLRVRNP